MRGSRSLDFLAGAAASPDGLEAGTLRAAIERCFRAVVEGGPLSSKDVATLNSFAGDEPPTPVLHADGRVSWAATNPIQSMLSSLARDAIETIERRAPDLRTCERCGGLFLDGSRGKRRRWCSMATCGNVEKAAAYRRRLQR